MKYRYGFIAFLIAFLLQSSVLHNISLFGVAPNLVLVLVIVSSFLFDELHGAVFGILFGLLQDMFFSDFVGISAIAYFLVALAVMEAKRYLYRDNYLSVIFISVGGTLGYNIIYWLISGIFGGIHQFIFMLAMQPVAIIYNTILVFILYWIIIRKVIKYRGFKYM